MTRFLRCYAPVKTTLFCPGRIAPDAQTACPNDSWARSLEARPHPGLTHPGPKASSRQ